MTRQIDSDKELECSIHVAFVVPAHNEQKHLKKCLESIFGQDATIPAQCTFSVTVVDNESTDQTVAVARQEGADVVHVAPGNPGRARNRGAARVEADLIAFVDADCVLPPDWLAIGLQHFQEPEIVAVGGIQALPTGDASWVERHWVRTIVPDTSEDWQSISWLPAFNLIVRRHDFDALGGFDESLTTCEDSDLSFRLASRGGQLRRDHRIAVLHLGESKTLLEFFRREMWRSRGNFRSAWKRGAVKDEWISLFLPLTYVTLLLFALALVISATLGAIGWANVMAVGVLAMAIPVGIAYSKRRSILASGPTSILFANYLVARGIGSVLPSARVERNERG